MDGVLTSSRAIRCSSTQPTMSSQLQLRLIQLSIMFQSHTCLSFSRPLYLITTYIRTIRWTRLFHRISNLSQLLRWRCLPPFHSNLHSQQTLSSNQLQLHKGKNRTNRLNLIQNFNNNRQRSKRKTNQQIRVNKKNSNSLKIPLKLKPRNKRKIKKR